MFPMFPFLQRRWIYRLNHEHDATSSALVCTNSEERGCFLGLFLSRPDSLCVFFLYFPLGQLSNAVPTCVTGSSFMFGVFFFLSLRLVLLSSRLAYEPRWHSSCRAPKWLWTGVFFLRILVFFFKLGCGFALTLLGSLIFFFSAPPAPGGGRMRIRSSFGFFLELRYGWNNVFSA